MITVRSTQFSQHLAVPQQKHLDITPAQGSFMRAARAGRLLYLLATSRAVAAIIFPADTPAVLTKSTRFLVAAAAGAQSSSERSAERSIGRRLPLAQRLQSGLSCRARGQGMPSTGAGGRGQGNFNFPTTDDGTTTVLRRGFIG